MHWNPIVGIPLLILGLLVLAAIWLLGQPRKPGQGTRRAREDDRAGPGTVRREPTLGEAAPELDDGVEAMPPPPTETSSREPVQASLLDVPETEEIDTPAQPPSQVEPKARDRARSAPAGTLHSSVGKRPPDRPMERIITVNVVASETDAFLGPDLVVAADKAGLEFGYKGIFHRMIEGKPELGPLFSVANMLQPGSFDLGRVTELTTTGISFFMTLPGPLPALDTWDAMLPTAQRMAELLGGQVLDDEHNALGRQRIAHLRDQLRAWDRAHQGSLTDFDS